MKVPAQKQKEGEFTFPLPFFSFLVPFEPLIDWLLPTTLMRADLLYSIHRIKCWSLQEMSTEAHPEKVFYQLPWHLLARSH